MARRCLDDIDSDKDDKWKILLKMVELLKSWIYWERVEVVSKFELWDYKQQVDLGWLAELSDTWNKNWELQAGKGLLRSKKAPLYTFPTFPPLILLFQIETLDPQILS